MVERLFASRRRVDAQRLARRLHSRGRVHCVPEQAVAWHSQTHHAGHHRSWWRHKTTDYSDRMCARSVAVICFIRLPLIVKTNCNRSYCCSSFCQLLCLGKNYVSFFRMYYYKLQIICESNFIKILTNIDISIQYTIYNFHVEYYDFNYLNPEIEDFDTKKKV